MIANFAYAVVILAAGALTALAFLSMPAALGKLRDRRDRRIEKSTTAEHRLIPEPHEGATEDGTGIVEAERDLLGVWTVPLWESRPSIFDELANRTPVRLDWEPEGFTAAWTRREFADLLAVKS